MVAVRGGEGNRRSRWTRTATEAEQSPLASLNAFFPNLSVLERSDSFSAPARITDRPLKTEHSKSSPAR